MTRHVKMSQMSRYALARTCPSLNDAPGAVAGSIFCQMWGYVFNYETYVLQDDVAQFAANQTKNTGANPFSILISVG